VPVAATAGGTSPGRERPCGAGREKGSGAVSPVAIVWPCPLAVDAYAAAGRDLGFPRPDCPSCAGPLVFWPGYRRYVREAGPVLEDLRARAAVRPARVSHPLLPAFTLAWRLDAARPSARCRGGGGRRGVRGPPGGGAGGGAVYDRPRLGPPVPARAAELGVAFAAVAVELGGQAVTPPAGQAGSR